MLMIRFQRIGRRNDAAFRIVVIEKARGPRAGKYVDLVGTYNPKTKACAVEADRIKEWITKGAQVSPSLKNLLITKGVLEGKKINVLPRKQPIKSEKKDGKDEASSEAAVSAEEKPSEEISPEDAKEEAPSESAKEEPAPAEAVA